ncbi:sugar ABC transporter permease [Clostridium sp. 1001271B_151109_B4]|uniref:carbohydrate ABC transporter permease n=1 Tax=Clostridium sp. 1001271B_151109_B4 TaxID=2787148 RepID=UPI0018A9F8D4|nr:sugar ABC transporter permease [Clostridium sp. 1001271B_151109_B4]
MAEQYLKLKDIKGNNISKRVSLKNKRVLKGKMEPYFYLIPAFIIFGLFVFYPFIKTIIMSMSTTNIRGEIKEFVGLENFKEILTSPEFYNSIVVTFKFVLLVAAPSVIIGFLLALLANNKLRGNRIFELMFSLPMAIASAPAAVIWTMIFHPTNGILNHVLGTQIGWLTDSKFALISVAIVTVWLNIGLNFIFLLTGLRNIPTELMESASIDGASYLTKVKKIIIPMVSPQMFLVIFMNLINAFQAFGQIKLLTQGGPGDSTNVLVHSIYREAFFNGRFEMACAQALILFVIMMIVTLLQFKFEKKGVHYQ